MKTSSWIALASLLSACSAQEPADTKADALSASGTPSQVLIGGTSPIEAIFPDGTRAVGWDEYETAVAAATPMVGDLGAASFTIEDNPDQPDTTTTVDENGIETTQSALTWKIGRFSVSLDPDLTFLGGCIQKRFLHIKAALAADAVPSIIELHLVGWFDKTTPCIGVMNTGFVGYGWCQKMCWTANKKDVVNAIGSGLIAAGVGGTTAAILARVITPIVTASLAL